MGLFKKIKKAVKKITNAPVKALAHAAGLDEQKQSDTQAPPADVAAPEVEPAKEVADDESGADTASDKKKARSGGKRSLSVARNSGAGINI